MATGRTATERALEAISGAGVVALVVYAFIVWPSLPARVPIHFGVSGAPNGWAPRGGLAIFPGTAVFSFLSITSAQRRGRYNFPVRVTPANADQLQALARGLLSALKAVMTAICGYVFWLCAAVARGQASHLPVWFLPAVASVLATLIGTAFVRMKRC